MMWGHPKISERLFVLRRRVSGIALPAVAGVLLRQIHHECVARHLGDNRSGGD